MPGAAVRAVDANTLVWSAYSEEVKVDLSSSAFLADGGWVLVDPIEFDAASFEYNSGGAKLSAIVLTNGNHQRDSLRLRDKFHIPILAHATAKSEIEADQWLQDDAILWQRWSVCPLPGFGLGEIALRSPSGPGTLIFGDAIINLPTHPFIPLPEKYCTDPALAAKSLGALTFRGDRCFFAHGEPILANGGDRLLELQSPWMRRFTQAKTE